MEVTDRRAEHPARATMLIAGKVKQTNTLTEQTKTTANQMTNPQTTKRSIKHTARNKHTGEREVVRSSLRLSLSNGTSYFHPDPNIWVAMPATLMY